MEEQLLNSSVNLLAYSYEEILINIVLSTSIPTRDYRILSHLRIQFCSLL
jgi:hypothetical protein